MMAAPVVDVAFVATSFDFPEPSLATLMAEPTVELVGAFLAHLQSKARDISELRAEKLRADVELESAIRAGETRAKQLKAAIDKTMEDAKDTAKRLREEQTAKAQLESEFHAYKVSYSNTDSQLQILQSKIDALSASKTETAALLDAKSTSFDRQSEELLAQQQRAVKLRHDVADLEAKLQSSENAAMSSKFREQALQQEVALVKKSSEWHEAELKTRNAEHTKYRKEKNGQVSELQRELENVSQEVETLRNGRTAAKIQVDELTRKADEAFVKVQQLEENAAQMEERFRTDVSTVKRLGELQAKSAATAKKRLLEIEEEMGSLKEEAAEEIGRLQAELDTERAEKETAESRMAELELQLEQTQLPIAGTGNGIVTPMRNAGADTFQTPAKNSLFGTPRFTTPGSVRGKNLTFTQLYSDYSQLKVELEAERQRNGKLVETVDEMISDLEIKGPEVQELQAECGRLQADLSQTSELLEEMKTDRDRLKSEARRREGQVSGLKQEGELLRQQLRDLSAQIRRLLVEIQAKERGLESLSAADEAMFSNAIDGTDIDLLAGMSDTGRLISERLVIYRNVAELQEQNSQLLHLTRKLGEQMEGDEARARRQQHEQDQEELAKLRERVQKHQDEMKMVALRSESYVRERDMFRRMLAYRGQLPADPNASMFEQSIIGDFSQSHAGPPPGHEEAEKAADYAKLLKELQQHFDSYKQESAIDHSTLRDQLDTISREKGDLQAGIAKANSQASLARERYELLQTSFDALRSEHASAQKRSQTISELAAKQEMKNTQVVEDLVEARALTDSMRNEVANLKAEKTLWKSIEARLVQDNQLLTTERSRLNRMVTDVQNLQNERELADAETRRRLLARSQDLELELSATKKKLDDEVTSAKKASERREFEMISHRARIDDLLAVTSSVKEELAAIRAQRDVLQSQAADLSTRARHAEEKAEAVLQREAPDEETAAIQMVSLRQQLEAKDRELEMAQADMDQYRSIAQTAEEELTRLQTTAEEFQVEMEKQVADRDDRIVELEKRVEELGAELGSANREMMASEERFGFFEQQKAHWEDDMMRLRSEIETAQASAISSREDIQAQAEVAERLQVNYEAEVVKHAEAMAAIGVVRAEVTQQKTIVVEKTAELEGLREQLAQNESSWRSQQMTYDRELASLREAKRELEQQNRIVHEQLESVSAQISSLREGRVLPAGVEVEGESTTDGLHEVVRFLRREKEIVDVQLEMSVQDGKRLTAKLEAAENQLEDVREKLANERQSQADRDAMAGTQARLVSSISELNLYRESNNALRLEARQSAARLVEVEKEVERLQAQLGPATARLRELESAVEMKTGELKLAQEDRDRWQTRSQQILLKYDRVDPAEMEALQADLEALRTAKAGVEQEKADAEAGVQARLDELSQTLRAEAQTERDALRTALAEQFKRHSGEQKIKIAAKAEEARVLEEQKLAVEAVRDDLEARLATVTAAETAVREELARIKGSGSSADSAEPAESAQPAAETEGEPVDAEMTDSTNPPTAPVGATTEEGEVGAATTTTTIATDAAGDKANIDKQALLEKLSAVEKSAEEERQKAETASQLASQLGTKVAELETKLTVAERKLAAAESKVSAGQSQPSTLPAAASQPGPATDSQPAAQADKGDSEDMSTIMTSEAALDEVARLELELKLAQEHLAAVKEIGDKHSDGTTTLSPEIATEIGTRMTGIEATMQEEYQKWVLQFQRRTERMRVKLVQLLAEEKKTLQAQHEAALAEIREQEGKPATDSAAPVPAAPSASAAPPLSMKNWNPSEIEVKDFVNENASVKAIISRNVIKHVNEAREKLSVEHAAQMKMAKNEMAATREREIMMADKKNKARTTMMENRLRQSTTKVEAVQEEAKNRPARPVGEVWDEIVAGKSAFQLRQQQQTQPSTPAESVSASVQATTPALPAVLAQSPPTEPATAQPVPSGPSAGEAASGPVETGPVETAAAAVESGPAEPQAAAAVPDVPQVAATAPGGPLVINPAPESQQPEQQQRVQQPHQQSSRGGHNNHSLRPAQSMHNLMRGNLGMARGGLPRPVGRAVSHGPNQLPPIPTGMMVGNANSTIGMQSSGPIRGTGPPRGGRRGGMARGGANQNMRGGANAASMNPAARQFVPSKRAREDGDLGGGKKPKGQ